MNKGTPGHNPISDVVFHHKHIFGEPADSCLPKMYRLMDFGRLYSWFVKLPLEDPADISQAIIQKHAECIREAEERGWEIWDCDR
jgi:hypothetical protein